MNGRKWDGGIIEGKKGGERGRRGRSGGKKYLEIKGNPKIGES